MIFTISEWPPESNLKHVATSWKLTHDPSGNEIESEIKESTTELTTWEVNTLIPTGKVWYVWALRKLKDSNGNYVDSNWIGPKPVFSENTNISEYLSPKLFISEPIIKSISYLPGKELTIEITEPRTNIGYKGTLVELYDDNEKLVYSKILNYNVNNGELKISANDVNFADIFSLGIKLINIANNSTISKVVRDRYLIKRVYYVIEGNKFNLDPNEVNKFKIVSTSQTTVNVERALLLDMDDNILEDLKIHDNEVIIPIVLKLESTYKIKLNLKYSDSSNKEHTFSDIFLITTIGQNEKMLADETYHYNYKVLDTTTIDNNYDDSGSECNYNNADYLNISRSKGNTEEFFDYITPIKMDNGKLAMSVIDKKNNVLIKFKDSDINISGDYTIRLITEKRGYIQTKDKDKLKIISFEYDPFTNVITTGRSKTFNIKIDSLASRKIMEMADDLYLIGINYKNHNVIDVYKINLDNMSSNLIYSYTYNKTLDGLSACEIDSNRVLIFPKGSNAFSTLVYSISTNTIIDTNDNYSADVTTIPSEFRNKNLACFRLKDGNIVAFKIADSNNKLNFIVYERDKHIIKEYNVDYNEDGLLEHFIQTRIGYIYLLVNKEQGKTRKFYKFH